MSLYGLIGFPLEHSFSKKYFEEKFRKENLPHSFELFELANIRQCVPLLQTPDLKGLAVTIPFKQQVMHYLDALDETAQEIGAVNCIVLGEKIIGYNTDVIGFYQSLKPVLHSEINNALVLGTGGSAAAVVYALKKLNIEPLIVSRKLQAGCITYNDLDESVMASHTLIVNCTPVGMYPNTEASVDIPLEFISQDHLVYDLIYNPVETLLMQLSKERGARVKNGLEMLHLQAEANWELWNGGSVRM